MILILVPRPGIEATTPALEGQSLYHWTDWEVPFPPVPWQYLWSTPAPPPPQSCPEAHTYFALFYFFRTDFFEKKGENRKVLKSFL